ncbi:MAG TPA: DUF4157 domain-containing protein [Thermodesulfobacteriota bacterium]|nr:DUF4157 domain-containing protein [Thermodesulfobacteriota bacterium]
MPGLSEAQRNRVSEYDKFPSFQRMCTECKEELHRQPVEKGEFIQAKSLSSQVTPLSLIQRQAEREEEEEMIQTKTVSDHADLFLQRQIEVVVEEEVLQTNPISGWSAPVIQKQTELEDKEGVLAKPEGDKTETPGTDFQAQLDAEKASGSPLPNDTRQFMESRFGLDFSDVRIHSSERAAALSSSIQAQAFTVGNDIYFGPGRYSPGSTNGDALIAHELVHTLQQNPQRLSSKKITSALQGKRDRLKAIPKTGAYRIQRYYTFGPPFLVKGTKIHSEVLPMFVKDKRNNDLFIEVAIPGAKKMVPKDIEKFGIADFYKAERTIGIRYQGDRFTFLEEDTKLQWGGGSYIHSEEAAPVGPAVEIFGCEGSSKAKICRLDVAPISILLGDLKPGGTAESSLGTAQISDYKSGLTITRGKVNDFIKKNPDKVRPKPRAWNLSTLSEIESLGIPPDLEYPSGKGINEVKSLSVYEGDRKVVYDSGLSGALYVYKDPSPGVWSYEWFPYKPPASVEGSEKLSKALDRLNIEVIPHLRKKHDSSLRRPPASGKLYSLVADNVRHSSSIAIQRQPKPGGGFDLKDWETKHYGPWKKDTKALLADKKKLGNAPVYAALVELNQRSPHKLPISEEVEKTGKGLSKLNHWVDWGGMFGKLRATFGGLFLKIVEAYEKLKKRFDKVPGESTKSFDFGSGPVGAAVKVAFGLMRQFLKIIAGRVAQNLTTRLKTGAEALAKHVFSESVTEKFTQNFEGLKTEIQKITGIADGLHRQFDAKVDEYLKEYEDEITFLNKIKEGLKTVGDIISIVKWGIRLFHCASPPIIGCIKLAFEKLTTALIEAVVKSCWFQEKAIRPLFNTIKFFKELPQNISDAVVKLLREIIPLSGPELDILLPSKIDVPPGEIGKGELKCAPDKPTPEQKALAELYDKYGDEKMNRMLKLLEAKGVEEGAKLTISDIQKIGKIMSKLSEDDLKKAEQNPDIFKGSDVGKELEEVVRDIKFETMEKEHGEAVGQIIETAEKTDKIAALVKKAEGEGLFDKYGWYMRWDKDKVKNNKVSAEYFTILDGENVAAFIEIEFIVLDYKNNWVSGRIVNSTYLVNAEGALRDPVNKKFFEGPLEGGSTVKE